MIVYYDGWYGPRRVWKTGTFHANDNVSNVREVTPQPGDVISTRHSLKRWKEALEALGLVCYWRDDTSFTMDGEAGHVIELATEK